MGFFRRRKAIGPLAVIFNGLFIAVFSLALHPRIVEPFGDRLPVKASKLAALADLIPGAALNRGFKPSHSDGRAAFFVTNIDQLIELQGVSILQSQRIHVPCQYPVDSSRLIRAPPLAALV